MATMTHRRPCLELFLLVFVACILQPGYSETLPELSVVQKWAEKLDNDFEKVAVDGTGSTVLTKNYQRFYDERIVKFGTVNSMTLVTEMAEKLTTMLGGKMESLRRSVSLAEKAAANHTWDPTLKLGNVDYWNSKEPGQLLDHLEYSERFKQQINATRSSVHIPVEIYEGDIHILNGLMWSDHLDTVFEENYQQDDDILWQYFGSQTGFMRTFPGSLWTTPDDEVDLYDVRRRPWYTQGSSSPKDMLILIDRSGSVHGKTLQLVKVAVKSILDTLGENDFVQIIMFSTEADYVSCFKTFVQANYRNKKLLGKAVDALTANGMANFKVGLNFAFEQFEKFEDKFADMNRSSAGEGADCNKMIMLLTDGGTDMAEEVFKERNWGRDRMIRVFTYAVGQTANSVKDIKWMSCANRGRFSEIPAMGAIRAKVQEYVPVLSRPQALQNKKLFKFGNIYQDRLGLGMMTTVTLPVYNRTIGASNQTILGVMGIDVTTAQMEQFSPSWKLGPNGYTFAINTNGYVIFHPLLKINHYLKDPPNMDFLDLEVENDMTVLLRKDMIDHVINSMTIETYVKSPDERHVDVEKRNYSYTVINGTNFSLGISLPLYQKRFPQLEGNACNITDMNFTHSEVLVAPWDYYEGMSSNNLTGFLADLHKVLKLKQRCENLQFADGIKVDMDKVKHLHWDMQMAKLFDIYWTDMAAYPHVMNKSTSDNDTSFNTTDVQVVAHFMGTASGITTVFPKSEAGLLEKDRDTWKAIYYRRSLDTSKSVFSVDYTLGKRSVNESVPNIRITRSITMDISGDTYKPAVAGLFISHETIVDVMLKTIEKNTKSGTLSCSDTAEMLCYLLDDGAFLIATNQPDKETEIGRFFGHVDAGLMSALYNETYLRLEQYDYQATCSKSDDGSNSAASLSFRIPSINLLFDLLTVNWFSSFWTWTAFNFNLFSWLSPQTYAASVEIPEEMIQSTDETDHCIKKQAQYYFSDKLGTGAFKDTIYPCDKNCTRDFYAVRFVKTNLLLLVATPECPDCVSTADSERLIQEPRRDEGPDYCNMKPRYRNNPEKCYDYDEKEDTTKCSGSYSRPVSAAVIAIATIASLLSAFLLTDR
ncbi:voltage-dependent calcium channel subunit alpha-2/delta-2-like isoform X2 [Mizuhopecten yessoensis]|uniref:voltage-dependent calcium channel subunit alpha-2/delta-2-like isoform X2 n=1 Tax=Mizuhopecten yessoensis TaxID=6573 RepID=UPI000B45CA67|nr:voltage-dependent calcium channel subunit alpha-2/delta-2-like isoform X2 [Mizuhopecten yessoensis]